MRLPHPRLPFTLPPMLCLLAAMAFTPATANETEAALPVFTLEEVAEHHSPDNCWMAIHGKVYDLTPYVPNHPGPAGMMLVWCGQESTEAWETKSYGEPHSSLAARLLQRYLIGTLEETD